MKNQRQQLSPKKYTHHIKSGASFAWAFTATMLVASSIAQASDMQIYAVPTAGKKTIVMMLDTSGSMGVNSSSNSINDDYTVCSDRTTVQTDTGGSGSYTYSRTYCSVPYSATAGSNYQRLKDVCYNPGSNGALKCYDRISRLKDGMFAFLDSNNSTLPVARVGLGHFSVDGSGKAGKILVPAEALGAIGSVQRNALKTAAMGLTASGRTPTATAYAEAAAYLMGTTTNAPAEIQKDLYKKVTTQVFDHYECQNSTRPYLNTANNTCYQYNTGFAGGSVTADTTYSCPPTGQPTFVNIGTSNSTNRTRCYINGRINDNGRTSYYRAANTSRSCLNSSYPFLNTATNICYQYQGFSGGTATPTTINQNIDTYYQCLSWRSTDFSNGVQYCGSGSTSQRGSNSSTYWTNLGSIQPANFYGDGSETLSGVVYSWQNEMQIGSNAYSGFAGSVSTSKKADLLSYQSPLPAAADRVSCDGQGVYVLSDGEANSMPSSTTPRDIMRVALGSTGTSFTCPTSGGLTNLTYGSSGESAWHCMGELATKLFNGGVIQTNTANATNPVNVPIQTAFVGFGSDFNAISESHVQQACKLSSRTQADRRGDDGCSPTGPNTSYRVTAPGYGNGGFFTTQTPQGVTDSVVAFINNLGQAPLAPITTGGISVPADPLSPSGLQPYGYLRALEPNPQSTDLIWAGNLKRYKVLLTGTNAGAFGAADGSTLVYNTDGSFRTGTKDLWNSIAVYNSRSYSDGAIVGLGGAYSRVPMPISGQVEDLTAIPKKYEYAAQTDALRKLYTDIGASSGATLGSTSNGANLLRIPEGPLPTTGVPAYVLGKFGTQTTLQDMPLLAKQKLLNYLGYSVALDSAATALPSTLTLSPTPHLAMGGSIHSFPVQMTYSATLDSAGNLTSTRTDSVLYGTMDGGLHVVDSATGVEQMVFVPSELLRDSVASKAIVKGQSDNISPAAGLDGSWVVDSLYTTERAASAGGTSLVKARRMNVYGGLRMGGESYYGLNLLDPTTPKFLFRAGRDQTDYTRMGQSWSKPVLANIRYNNAIKRVLIVGGGYDQCYENPQFSLNSTVSSTDFPDTTCNNKSAAQGNAVYIIDATTGARLWWASSSVSGIGTANTNMTHSIVSRISAIDGDGDGLIDNLYFGDLGGQVFRADLNNTAGTSTANFGKRVVRLANLATDTNGTALTGGKNPRFYEAPTVTIHDQGATTFMLIGLASGNRSAPLDVFPLVGREGMKPTNALSDRLVNNVYGVIDRDFIKSDLITGTPTLETENINMSTFQKDPQTLTGNIPSVFVGASATKNGWYRSLSSNYLGTERADNSFRIKGGMKAFEEPVAITGNLIVPVYDPQGTGITPQNPCLPRVVGETDRQRYCLPFGACLNTSGTINSTDESSSGFKTTTTCPTGSTATECNSNVIGLGIVGITPAPVEDTTGGSCPDFTIAGNDRGTGRWQCIPTVNPTRWYERWKK